MKFFLNKQKGFTLIELMVVVGIIAILSSILYANFNEARMIARDKTRMTTLKEVQLALEVYKAQNGEYPAAGCGAYESEFAGPGTATMSGLVSCKTSENNNYIVGLAPEFIATLPLDPVFENEENKGYYYRSDGSSYKFMSYDAVEVNEVNDFGHEFARCPAESGQECSFTNKNSLIRSTYAVYSDGAQDW